MTWSILLLIVGGLVGLVFGGDLLVKGATRLAATLGVPSIIIGLTVVAFGTSTPELAVSLDAALQGNADISIANVVGSNIFNILLILGISALIHPLIIQSQMIRREVPIMIAISILFYMFSLGGEISRIEGVILFLGILSYTGWLVFEALKHRKEDQVLRAEMEQEHATVESSKSAILKSVGLVIVGLGLVMLGANWMVDGAISLARTLGVSDAVIGLTIVAAGTSLPEVVASVMATIKGERDIAIGNVVGSNIYNILGIIGLSGAIVPSGLSVSESILSFDMPVMVATAVLCWIFLRTGHKLTKLEGSVFLALYVGYTATLIYQATGI